MALPGCGLFKKKDKPKPNGPKTTLIGIVDMVNPEQNYVLIRCDQVPRIEAGTELVAVDATGKESRLKLTPERKGRFLTADIQSGQPQVTNLVVHRTSGDAPLNTPFPPVPEPPPTLVPQPVPPIPLEPVTDPQTLLEPLLPTIAPLPLTPPSSSELEPAVE
ncbi:hypothetical protein [Prosthecobacter fusiformis]|nr:hypothetical protein [Prosthecobacter fusiformis]